MPVFLVWGNRERSGDRIREALEQCLALDFQAGILSTSSGFGEGVSLSSPEVLESDTNKLSPPRNPSIYSEHRVGTSQWLKRQGEVGDPLTTQGKKICLERQLPPKV